MFRWKCINCSYCCEENTLIGNKYFYNKTCCPKDYPLTIYLRQLANYKTWINGTVKK